ncbi:MAG: triacylglycerol lipase [Deltaproteobacteria bacterium]|nr:triacylglycerol lipase [Deltaproteobacteria bacterium]
MRLRVHLPLAILLFCACPQSGNNSFYTPPAPLPAGQPGDVIRSRASVYTLDPVAGTPVPGVWSRQVLYLSESALGEANAVSGTVLVPTAPWSGPGQRPLISYAVGTRGVGDACAPSKTLSTGTDYEGLFIQALLDRGWAVAISDYEGLGTPGMHTYVVGQSEGRAVLDMARAAQRLAGSGLGASTPVALMGYSQGGGAAGWAGELAPGYAPELNLKAVVAGGVPGDLLATAEFVDGGPFVALELLAALGLDAAYPELDLEDYLDADGEALVAEASNTCLASFDGVGDLFSTLFASRSDFTHTDPLAAPAWQARLDENRLGSSAPAVPVFQFHAVLDEMVPFGQAADLRRDWCDQGANVTWTPLVVAEHVLGMVEGQPLALAFLASRFAGLPALGNCWLP